MDYGINYRCYSSSQTSQNIDNQAVFTFKRRSGFFILQAYVPTYMTIFVAWINFWMDPRDQLATRATLSACCACIPPPTSIPRHQCIPGDHITIRQHPQEPATGEL